jgi:hypothetical protein
VPPSRVRASSIKSGPLDKSSTAYVSSTRGGREQQHNAYADRPDMERAEHQSLVLGKNTVKRHSIVKYHLGYLMSDSGHGLCRSKDQKNFR